ncbi:alpha-L-rhamnosidase [Paenibacillus macerans]|uniref:alpha-L-rhamnosidase n=1 Tax=Paenibacillus macerans TaxID=44252 RepID=UPI0020408FCB|nr:alpha-L-rhamnosidase [Paenibacillus macerans]MCM3702041.1 glycoside hydrolase family 78 protein [Paenibacillus macerans]
MAIHISRLLIEDEERPLAVGADHPRFSWELEADTREGEQWNQSQSAYRVLVADSEEKLAEDCGNMWDSGIVAGDQSVYIPYAGRRLAPGCRYYCKAAVWDKHGAYSGWSKIYEFGTALSKEQWLGSWIGKKAAGEEELVPVSYMRTEFRIDKPVRCARLYASALGMYEARLNGKRVGDHQLAPGWTDYGTRVQYQVYDVAELLLEGGNAWGALLGTGWYAGNVGMMGVRRYGEDPRCLMELKIEYADGSKGSFCTDGGWRLSEGPVRYSDMIKGERYDARLEQKGWDCPGFNDTAWSRAEVFEPYEGLLVPQNGPPVRVMQTIEPVRQSETSRGTVIYDFGQNLTGWTALEVTGPEGAVITVNHAEMLDQDGSLYTVNLRRAVQICEYVLDGSGEARFEPHFTFQGFRYAEIECSSPDIRLKRITAKVVHSDMPAAGKLETSDPLVNRLIANIVWGQRGNFLSVPTDCPQRDERLGWTGDAQIFARTASYNMNVAGFFRKYLVDVFDAQSPDGALPDVAPDAGWHIYKGLSSSKWFAPDNAGWGDAGIIIPWTLYLMYGDLEILRKHYIPMHRWIDYLRANSEGCLRPGYADHADWLSIGADTPKDVLATAYFGYSTFLFARIAGLVGKQADAKMYGELFEEIREAFIRAYVSADGVIQGDTQTVYCMALCFHLLTPELRLKAASRLERRIKDNGNRLTTGFLGVGYLLPALSDSGRTDLAYKLLHQEEFPSWLYSVKHGATTIWERWDGWTEERGFQSPSMNSFNHYSLGSVGEWLYRYAAGLEADWRAPGFKHSLITPEPGGKLTGLRAEYASPYGLLAVEWRRDGDRLELNVRIPVNTTADIYVPGRLVEADAMARKLKTENGKTVYAAGSGRYRFVSVLGAART